MLLDTPFKYRFIEWYTATPNRIDIWGTELYDHTKPKLFLNNETQTWLQNPDRSKLVSFESRHLLVV